MSGLRQGCRIWGTSLSYVPFSRIQGRFVLHDIKVLGHIKMDGKQQLKEVLSRPDLFYKPASKGLLTGTRHCGIYWKPIARLVAYYLRRKGYRIWLRGRGTRKGKDVNSNGDLKLKDAVFCAVYIRRRH
jgi:hypothetical protein